MAKNTYGIEITNPAGGILYTNFHFKLSKTTEDIRNLVEQIENENLENYKLKILQLPDNCNLHEDNYTTILEWEF